MLDSRNNGLEQAGRVESTITTTRCTDQSQLKEFVSLRDSLPEHHRVLLTPYSIQQYNQLGADLHLSTCRRGGYGILGDELISLFSLPNAKIGSHLVRDALSKGARRLCCYDVGVLEDFYTHLGFQVKGRIPLETSYDSRGLLQHYPDCRHLLTMEYSFPRLELFDD